MRTTSSLPYRSTSDILIVSRYASWTLEHCRGRDHALSSLYLFIHQTPAPYLDLDLLRSRRRYCRRSQVQSAVVVLFVGPAPHRREHRGFCVLPSLAVCPLPPSTCPIFVKMAWFQNLDLARWAARHLEPKVQGNTRAFKHIDLPPHTIFSAFPGRQSTISCAQVANGCLMSDRPATLPEGSRKLPSHSCDSTVVPWYCHITKYEESSPVVLPPTQASC